MSDRDSTAVDLAGSERRTWWGRIWRYWIGVPVYWFDCRGPDGRPSHAKVLSTIGFFVGLYWVSRLLERLVELLGTASAPPGWLATLILAFASLVFTLPYGLDGMKVWLKTRGGGTVDALARSVEASFTPHQWSSGEPDAGVL